MQGKIQSDRLEGEFGIYRQSSGGNYTISAEQFVSSSQLHRLKLFYKPEIHMEGSSENFCCETGLIDSEEDLDLIERCFEESSNLSLAERSSLFYMSGYVARKEGIQCSNLNISDLPESEITEELSRGKLSLPPNDLYDLSLYIPLLNCEKISVARRYIWKPSRRYTHILDTDFQTNAAFLGDSLIVFSKPLRKTLSNVRD